MIYYFSTSGSDLNSGMSASSPWQSASKFSTFSFMPGDQILFKRGDVFSSYFMTLSRSGSVGNNIILGAYGYGVNPEFNGAGSSTGVILTLNAVNYIYVQDLVFKNTTTSHGLIFGNSCSNISFSNNYLDTGAFLMLIRNSGNNLKFLNNYMTNVYNPNILTQGGSAIQLSGCNGSGIEIAGNKYYQAFGPGDNPNQYTGDILSLYKSFGTSDSWIKVHDNWVRGGGTGKGSLGVAGIIAGDVGGGYQEVYNNILIDTGYAGIQPQGGSNINVHDNKIYGSVRPWSRGGINVANYGGTPSVNITVANNKSNWVAGYLNMGQQDFIYKVGIAPSTNVLPTGWSTNIGASSDCNDSMLLPTVWTGTPWSTATSGFTFGALSPVTYGASDFDPGATSALPIAYASSNTSVASIVAGKIHITGAGSTIITANDGTGPLTQVLLVNKAVLTVTADSKAKTYGAANPVLTLTYSGFQYSDTAASLPTQAGATTVGGMASLPGNYPIVASGAVAYNYSFVYINGSLTIGKTNLSVTADSKAKNYGDANPALTLSYSGFVNSESPSDLNTQPTAATSAGTASNAGTYSIVPSGGVSDRYNFIYTNGVLTISKLVLTVSANNSSRFYGASNPSFGITYSGFAGSDTQASLTTMATASSAANNTSSPGNYAIVPSGASSPNYTFTYLNGNLVVNQAPLTISADNLVKTYNSVNPTLTASYSGFVNGENNSVLTAQPVLTTTAVTNSPVGNYPITVSGATAANYSITFVNGILNIGSVAINFNPIPSPTYGMADFNPGATSAIAISYSSSDLTVATIVSGKIHIVGAGNCVITASNGSGSATQPLTVIKANLNISADSKTVVQGSAIPALTIQYFGFVKGETTANLTTQATASTTATSASPVGNYDIVPAGAAAANYNFIYTKGVLYVIPNGAIYFNGGILLLT